MRMDKSQCGWAVASLAILTVSAAVYILYALESPQGALGGSTIGLTFGVIGFGFMLFAALLGARKRVPTWRVGRAQAWMRGHLWLGFLALPMILFHGGFHFGGALTRVLMWLLMITVLSGVLGAVLQHYIPRVMTSDVPLETIYDEIGRVRTLLREEADRAFESLCGSLGLQIFEWRRSARWRLYCVAGHRRVCRSATHFSSHQCGRKRRRGCGSRNCFVE